MDLITELVGRKRAHILPSKFAIAFYGWTSMQTHIAYVFSLFPSKDSDWYGRALFGFLKFRDEIGIDASSQVEFFVFVLSVFDKNMESLTAAISDNCITYKSVADMLGEYFLGCYSHKFIQAVQDILKKYSKIKDTVYGLILKIQNLVLAAILCSFRRLRPIFIIYT